VGSTVFRIPPPLVTPLPPLGITAQRHRNSKYRRSLGLGV